MNVMFLSQILCLVISFPLIITQNEISDVFCAANDYIEPSWSNDESGNYGDLSINLRLYYDLYLLRKHKMNRTSVETFINRTITNTALTYKYPEIARVARINFWIETIDLFNETGHNIRGHDLHDADKYLDKFCKDIKEENKTSLIYSLFTGYDILRNGSINTKSVQGLAFSGSMCKESPCLIVEGSYYKAAIVSAHEIGHILGMNHDEINTNTIMHNSTGRGKNRWSDISIGEMKGHFNKLKKENNWCISESNATNIDLEHIFHQVDIGEQCRQMFGPEFEVYHRDKPLFNSICQRFYCRNGPFLLKGHMALDGTECDSKGRYCRGGQCMPPPDRING